MSKSETTIVITGSSGYIGSLLVAKYLNKPADIHVIGVDKEPPLDFLEERPNYTHYEANTASMDWGRLSQKHDISSVVHAAWQIRELYGQRDTMREWNMRGTQRVINFCFSTPSVKQLVFFSTVAVYGARSTNAISDRFTEDDSTRQAQYLYAEQKRQAEQMLKERYDKDRKDNISVYIFRPASITGPWSRKIKSGIGLQSALSGRLDDSKSVSDRIVAWLTKIMPVTKEWCRQFVHEDDVVSAVDQALAEKEVGGYNVYNLSPPGPVITGNKMANIMDKKTLRLHPRLVQLAYFLAWHLTQGAIPTASGAWRYYAYPIAVDGKKITKELNYSYNYSSREALTTDKGVEVKRIARLKSEGK